MRNKLAGVLLTLAVAALVLTVDDYVRPRESVYAQTTGYVQGVMAAGSSSTTIRPVITGAVNAGTVVADSADSSGRRIVVGPAAEAAAAAGNPIRVGGVDGGGNIRSLPVAVQNASGPSNVLVVGGQNYTGGAAVQFGTDALGRLVTQGQLAAGTAMTGVVATDGRPVLTAGVSGAGAVTYPQIVADGGATGGTNTGFTGIAGYDGSLARFIRTDTSGVLQVADRIGPRDTLSRVSATSNGVTNVTLKSASGSLIVYVAELLFDNGGTVSHTVTVSDTNANTLATFHVPAGSTGTLGNNGGLYQTAATFGLRFNIDAGGSATDVVVTGTVVQK